MEIPLPIQKDYPQEIFRSDLAPEYRVGCAEAYFKTNFLTRRLFRRRIEIAFQMMSSRQWDRALDAGTGAGFVLPALASRARAVDAVDLSPVLHYTQGMLDKRGLHNVKLVEADLLHLPYPVQAFDLAVCLSVIEHIPQPLAALEEIARVLRKDGMFILGYPLEHALLLSLEWVIRMESRLRRLIQRQPLPRGKPFHPHISDCRDLEKTVEKVFNIESRRTIRLLGCPVYRILKLRKTAGIAVFYLAFFVLG